MKVEVNTQTIVAAAQVILILYILYSILLKFYYVFFHPLAKYPGPWYRAAFYFPFHLEHIQGIAPYNHEELHKRYGPVVRIGPDQLTFTASQAWKDIYGFQSDRRQIPKDYKRFPNLPENLPIFSSNDAEHTRLRRLVAHAFSETALREQEPLIHSHIDKLIQQIRTGTEKSDNHSIDMSFWLDLLTLDVLGDLTYGDSFHGLETGVAPRFIQELYQGSNFGPLFLTSWDYAPMMWVLKAFLALPQTKKHIQGSRIDEKAKLERRRQVSHETRKDFMTYMLPAYEKGDLTENELLGLAQVFMGAGTEEPAATMSNVLYYLLKHPEAYQKARYEIREAFESADQINSQAVAELPYLDAVLSETMRVNHSGAQRFSRRTIRTENIAGYIVPPNTSIDVNLYAVGRDERNYVNATSFVPERWLSSSPEKFARDDKAAFQPFGTGPRVCIGKNLAKLVMRTTLAQLLWHFDMELCVESQDWIKGQRLRICWHRPPLFISLRPRFTE